MKQSAISFIFQDWKANASNPKGRLFLVLFRMANLSTRSRIYFYVSIPYLIIYKIFVQMIFALEVPWNITAGDGLKIYHLVGLIINKDVVIGSNCILRHSTTIGNKLGSDGRAGASPVIGDNVDVGCNSCIIGNIAIGDNVRIGSGSVVVRDIPNNAVVAGNPAVVKYLLGEESRTDKL